MYSTEFVLITIYIVSYGLKNIISKLNVYCNGRSQKQNFTINKSYGSYIGLPPLKHSRAGD